MRSSSAVKLGMSLVGAAFAVVSLIATTPACSTDGETCDPSQCLAGNKCLPLDGKTECRKTCSSNVDPTSSCPFGYTCVDTKQAGAEPFCVQDTPKLTRAAGQWGTACAATGGLAQNPSCDVAQGFFCYGLSPTDGDAYCTRFNCETDRDCGAGFTCQDVNAFPDVETTAREPGTTIRVCVKRDFCAACTADLDCPPLNGVAQRCVVDYKGAGFCAPTCTTNANCGPDSTCSEQGGIPGVKTCFPRSSTCVGDGSICEPCRSDKDCGEDGACVKGQYTNEKSCAKKSTIPCTKADKGESAKNGVNFQCPAAAYPEKATVGCFGKGIFFDEVPKDYCHGIYSFGESADVGCWSKKGKAR